MFLAQNGVQLAVPTKGRRYRNIWNADPAQRARAAQVFDVYSKLQSSGAIVPVPFSLDGGHGVSDFSRQAGPQAPSKASRYRRREPVA